VCGDLVFLMISASANLSRVHPLSTLLAVIFALYLITLAVGLSSAAYCLTLGSSLRKERSLFGVSRVLGDVRLEAVRGVHAIGERGAERWHVLVDSADGPLAIPVPRGEAQALAREIESAVTLARVAG
jgi:hypothetical protein